MIKLLTALMGSLLLLGSCAPEPDSRAPLILAASSMQESLDAVADAWAAEGHQRPTISYAASSALARQIESGAKTDLFISADLQWMDHVEQAGAIQRRSRRNLAGNTLVLIAPAGSGPVQLDAAAIDRALADGRLSMADPDSVPAGRYGKAALVKLELWPVIANRIAPAENVRAALALVERGEAPLGIVYGTDARASDKVAVVATLPAASHPPIVYPVALLKTAGPGAEPFYRFLVADKARAILADHGFSAPPR